MMQPYVWRAWRSIPQLNWMVECSISWLNASWLIGVQRMPLTWCARGECCGGTPRLLPKMTTKTNRAFDRSIKPDERTGAGARSSDAGLQDCLHWLFLLQPLIGSVVIWPVYEFSAQNFYCTPGWWRGTGKSNPNRLAVDRQYFFSRSSFSLAFCALGKTFSGQCWSCDDLAILCDCRNHLAFGDSLLCKSGSNEGLVYIGSHRLGGINMGGGMA